MKDINVYTSIYVAFLFLLPCKWCGELFPAQCLSQSAMSVSASPQAHERESLESLSIMCLKNEIFLLKVSLTMLSCLGEQDNYFTPGLSCHGDQVHVTSESCDVELLVWKSVPIDFFTGQYKSEGRLLYLGHSISVSAVAPTCTLCLWSVTCSSCSGSAP